MAIDSASLGKILLCNSNKNMDDGREWKPKNRENKTGEKRYGEDMSKKNLDAKEENVDFFIDIRSL